MSYTKHNYQKGDELLASQLNEMDDQIALNEQTADILVTVSNTEPQEEKNRIWVKATTGEVQVPTVGDLDEKAEKTALAELSDIVNTKAPAIYDTATGDIASFPDGADDMPIKELVANIEPVKAGSGDPSPTNVRPITGHTGMNVTRTGKNLVDPSTIINNKYVRAGNTSASSPLGAEVDINGWACTDYILVNPSHKYTTCMPKYTGALAAGLVFFEEQTIESAISGIPIANQLSGVLTFTTPGNCNYIRFSWPTSSGTSYPEYPYPMLVEGTDTDYEPYTGTNVPISWETEAGTVYGGTLTLNEDGSADVVVTNELYTFPQGSAWTYYNPGSGQNTFNTYFNIAKGYSRIILDRYQYTTATSIETQADKTAMVYRNNSNVSRLSVRDDDYSSADDFSAAVEGMQVVYTLKEPVTYHLDNIGQLTTLLGTNNIWSDTGEVSVTYPADTKLYIDRKIAEALS
jgi:hypothetical protein